MEKKGRKTKSTTDGGGGGGGEDLRAVRRWLGGPWSENVEQDSVPCSEQRETAIRFSGNLLHIKQGLDNPVIL